MEPKIANVYVCINLTLHLLRSSAQDFPEKPAIFAVAEQTRQKIVNESSHSAKELLQESFSAASVRSCHFGKIRVVGVYRGQFHETLCNTGQRPHEVLNRGSRISGPAEGRQDVETVVDTGNSRNRNGCQLPTVAVDLRDRFFRLTRHTCRSRNADSSELGLSQGDNQQQQEEGTHFRLRRIEFATRTLTPSVDRLSMFLSDKRGELNRRETPTFYCETHTPRISSKCHRYPGKSTICGFVAAVPSVASAQRSGAYRLSNRSRSTLGAFTARRASGPSR